MRYDNMLWVLIAPAFASCVCFASEMFCSFAESWNHCFDEIRRGFEMVSGKAKRANSHFSFRQVQTTNRPEVDTFVAGQKRAPLEDIRALFPAKLLEPRELGSSGRRTEDLE